MPSRSTPDELPADAQALLEKHAKSTSSARRFTGSKIDITNVHVPRHALASKRAEKSEQTTTQMPEEIFMEKRPLFATVDPNKKHPKKKRATMHLGKKEKTIVLSLLAVALLALGLAGFIFLPSAKIALTLQTAPLLVDQKVTISSSAASVPNAIPGSPFTEDVSVQGSSPVTSTEFVGSKAKGTVQLINKTFDVQKIKEHSRLITKDGVLFYISGSATIPEGSGSGVGAVNVQVESAEAGPKGNISAQQLQFAALDKSAQALVFGQSQGTFTGGKGDQVKVIKDADIAEAKTAAGLQAKSQVDAAARAQLQKGWAILEESWDSKITEFAPTGKVGDKVDAIPYTAKASVRVLAYKEDTLMTALENALKARLDANYMLFPGPISYTKSVDAIDWAKGEGAITARVTHTTIPSISIDTLTDKLAGRKKEEAISYLQGLPGVQYATIDLWPFWVQSVPEIQKRVDISVKSDREL